MTRETITQAPAVHNYQTSCSIRSYTDRRGNLQFRPVCQGCDCLIKDLRAGSLLVDETSKQTIVCCYRCFNTRYAKLRWAGYVLSSVFHDNFYFALDNALWGRVPASPLGEPDCFLCHQRTEGIYICKNNDAPLSWSRAG